MRRLIIRIRATLTRKALIATQHDFINLADEYAGLLKELTARRNKLARKLADLGEAERNLDKPIKCLGCEQIEAMQWVNTTCHLCSCHFIANGSQK